MRRCKTAFLSLLLLPAALALAACGASRGANTLTLYNGQHEQTTQLLASAFEKQTGIKVEVRTGDEAALANQLVQEGSSSPADIFYAANSPALESLRERGLLAPVAGATLAAVPGRDSSSQGSWVGVSARVSVLVYDTSRIAASAVPSSILELAQPRWRGKVGFAPSETDFQPLITSISRLDGQAAAERWLAGLRANGTAYSNNESLLNAVNGGQSAIGPIDHYYWHRLRQELGAGGIHCALAYLRTGDSGALVNLSGAALLRSSVHQSEGQRFLAFLVSAAGQSVIAHSHSYEYPLRPGTPAPAGLPALARLEPSALTPAQLGDGHAALALEQRLGLL